MSNEPVDEEVRAWVRAIFAGTGDTPRDVVRGEGLTVEALDRQNANQGWNEVTRPGEITLDLDGIPTGVNAPTTEIVHSDTIVSPSELHRLGVTVDQAKERWPNLIYINAEGARI